MWIIGTGFQLMEYLLFQKHRQLILIKLNMPHIFIQQLFFYLYWNLSLQRSCRGIFITPNKHRHLKLILQDFLRDRNKVQQLVQIFDPFVRAFDEIAGERVSMRVRIYKQKHIRNFAGYFFYELMLLIQVSEWEKKGEKDELILCFSTG